MTLAAGLKLGPYEILGALGAGGMGEVYRARDTRLGRDVAIKVLPERRMTSPEVRARFEREARTISSLNHPHICTLHDVGREGDTDYLVMELVEGESLAERLQRGPLPLGDVLRIGVQVADALARAHRGGVVHRDLKPANIMLTRTGAKLMDFGLARTVGLAGASEDGATVALSHSPTMAAALTAEGSLVGTFQYMSPEQLEGREADARSDIWAFGCVLYEMATGRRAFDGPTQASLISAIMRDTPRPLSELAPVAPAELERLIRQCLEKDPEDRWQSAADLRRELARLAGSPTPTSGVTPGLAPRPRRSFRRLLPGFAVGAAVAIAALLYAFGPWARRSAEAPLTRFMIEAPLGMTLGAPSETAVSPDGRMIAHVAYDSSGTGHLFVRALDQPYARAIVGVTDATLPFWSPDSRSLAYFSLGKLRKVSLDGGSPQVLCDAPDARGGAWSRDGEILFAPDKQSPIYRVSDHGGVPVVVTRIDSSRKELGHRYPQFLPDGRHFLYVAVGSSEEQPTYVASVSGGEPVEICRAGSGARYVEPGYLLYLDAGVNAPQRRLLARRFDAGSRRTRGEARLVLDDVDSNNFGYSNVDASPTGMLVVEHWALPHRRVRWRDRAGKLLQVVVEDLDAVAGVWVDPTGSRMAYSSSDPVDLHVFEFATGVSTRVTFENQAVGSGVWSPDGSRIAFSRLFASRGWETRLKRADGGGPDSLVFHAAGLFSYPSAWSSDGRWLVVRASDAAGQIDLWRVPMTGGEPSIYEKTAADERSASLSPDDRWIATTVTEDNRRALYVQSFPEPGARHQVAVPDPLYGQWAGSGQELLVLSGDGALHSVSVSTTNGFRQGAVRLLFRLPPGEGLNQISSNGTRFLTLEERPGSGESRLEVILGWTKLLERR